MNSEEDFNKLIKELQRKIEKEEEKIFSKTVIDEYRNPNNFGVIKDSDAYGEIKGSCGDTMRISLKIKDDKIVDAYFYTDGCGASIACGSMLTKMIIGKNIETAYNITSNKLLDTLGGLPKENIHCTVLAVKTLHKALKNIRKNK